MKKIWILTLALFAAGTSFAADVIRKPVEPTYVYDPHYHVVKAHEPNTADKIVEKAPQFVDSVATALEKAPAVVDKVASTMDSLSPKKSHIYLRMNVLEPNPSTRRAHPLPGVGLGYRQSVGSSAVDVSAGYSQRKTGSGGKNEFITLPRIGYFYYLSPVQATSLYAGPAVALGRIRTAGGNLFEGLIPSLSFGYEISRKASLLSFFQLDVSFPVVASRLRGPLPGIIGELAFGAGF